jgi:glycosyltransferase involved in cell wall biosynthesis
VTASISVVIPAYKAQAYIRRPVASVLQQTRTDWELVIASDDGVDYVRLLREDGVSDPRLRCVFTQGMGTGPANARNTGLDAAQARIVAMLDADDAFAPNALELLVPRAREHGAAYSRPRFFDHATNEELESLDRPLAGGLVTLEDVLTSHIHTYAGLVIDRTRVTARWPTWMQRWEDVFYYVQCFDDIDRMFHIAQPLYDYYRVPGSICNRPETGQEYLDWAALLERRLERGEDLGLRNDASRQLFWRFLRSRHVIEAEFIEALQTGRCQDFHGFIKSRRDLFYKLGSLVSTIG